MKKVFGSFVIIASIALLVVLFQKIGLELKSSRAFSEQFDNAVQITDPTTNVVPTILKDRNGTIFSEEYTDWREPVKLADIPEFMQNLFIYSEDASFYDHIGFDMAAIARAFMVNNSSGAASQGGSTITQQLVRMRYLTQEKTYERKMLEIFYAYELERKSSKEEILNSYLNEMYFSNGVYGVSAAASYYFDKPLNELSRAQMAFLAAIPNNPSLYNPLTNFDNTKKRQKRLLNKMVEKNIASKQQVAIWKKEAIHLSIKKKKQNHPAYSSYVMNELTWLVAERDGYQKRLDVAKTSQQRARINKELKKHVTKLRNKGLIIETALDQTKQSRDTASINSLINGHKDLQAASVVIDNATREIVSVYGGKNFKRYEFNRAYQAVRQPGSAIKPILDYAPYIEKFRATPDSIVSGAPFCHKNYCPENKDGVTVRDMSLETGFKYSYNTVAIRLFDNVGLATAFRALNQFDFRSVTKSDRRYTSALGGFEYGVTTAELADAYTSFDNGEYYRSHAIRSVKSRDGQTLYTWPDKKKEVWAASTAETVRALMQATIASGTGTAISVPGASYIGAKTGTTNNFFDLWTAGLTDRYTSAVWIGYDTPRSMQALENAKIQQHIFSSIMRP